MKILANVQIALFVIWISDIQKGLFAYNLQNRCFKNFAIFIGNQVSWNICLKKFQAFNTSCFPLKFPKCLRTPFIRKHIQWLPLEISYQLSLFVAYHNNEWCHFVVRICSPTLISIHCVCFVSIYFFFFFPCFLWTLIFAEVLGQDFQYLK